MNLFQVVSPLSYFKALKTNSSVLQAMRHGAGTPTLQPRSRIVETSRSCCCSIGQGPGQEMILNDDMMMDMGYIVDTSKYRCICICVYYIFPKARKDNRYVLFDGKIGIWYDMSNIPVWMEMNMKRLEEACDLDWIRYSVARETNEPNTWMFQDVLW